VNQPTGRVAIVTGAGRGIGARVAERLAGDGLAVGVLDLDEPAAKATAAAITARGGTAIAVGGDVGNPEQVEEAVSQVALELGPPTVLVSNAGVTRDALLFKMTESDWDTVINVHLRGAFLTTRAVQRYMTAAGWGRSVPISGTYARGNRVRCNSAESKAGLKGFTKTVAIELGKFGITANCVAPGFIATDMTRATAKRLGTDWDEFVGARASQIPVGRAGQPEDIAHAVSFFASEGAGFISGQVLYVAGGPKA
jgi:3-oxoacyl-[acyl-carrier protein] reductase